MFRSLGATVEEVDLGWTIDALKAGVDPPQPPVRRLMARLRQEAPQADDAAMRVDFAEHGSKVDALPISCRSIEVATKMYATLGPILEKYDVLICPTTALPAARADFDPTLHDVRINGKKVDVWPIIGWCMTTPFNTMSRCPVLSVPSGRAGNGVPTGIQIVGRTYSDADVFRAGHGVRDCGRRLVWQAGHKARVVIPSGW